MLAQLAAKAIGILTSGMQPGCFLPTVTTGVNTITWALRYSLSLIKEKPTLPEI